MIDRILQDYGPFVALVWSRMWRYTQMKDGLCTASLPTIGAELRFNRDTVRRAVRILVEDGFFDDLDQGANNGHTHRYRDTGKASIYGRFDAIINDADNNSDRTPRGETAGLVETPRGETAGVRGETAGYPADKPRERKYLREVLKDTEESKFERMWLSIKGQLKSEMPKNAYDTFVKDTRLAEMRQDGSTMVWVVACPPLAAPWMTSRLTASINRQLVGLANMADVRVEFIDDCIER